MTVGHTVVGHPIDVASGEVYIKRADIVPVPGQVELPWERRYRGSLLQRPATPLGAGWTTRYFAALKRTAGGFEFFTPEGDMLILPDERNLVDKGETIRALAVSTEITERAGGYLITRWLPRYEGIERYVFTAANRSGALHLTAIEDETGHGLDLQRDEAGRVGIIRQRLEGRSLVLQYNNDRLRSVSFSSATGESVTLVEYEYDSAGRLTGMRDVRGRIDRYEYDHASRLSSDGVRDGETFYFLYDAKDRCIKTAGVNRFDEKTLHYREHIGWTEVTDSLGNVTRYQYNERGQIIAVIDPLNGVRMSAYDEHGRMVSETAPNGGVTEYKYDASGNLCTNADALGQQWRLTFNDAHLALTLTDPAGNVWSREYDASNRLTAVEDPLGGKWTLTYNDDGQVVTMTEPNGASVKQSYPDSNGRMEATDWEGNLTRYVVDRFGRVVERHDPTGGITRYGRDVSGNILIVQYPNGSRAAYQYDSEGRICSETDPAGHVTRYQWGYCGRLVRRTNPDGQSVTYDWSSEPDQLTGVTNQLGEKLTFTYDANGRVIQQCGFDDRTLYFEYDAGGNRIAIIDGLGEKLSYSWDLLGRLDTKRLPDGSVTTFQYDPLGNLTSIENPDCKVRFERDALGRITKEMQDGYVVETKFDPAGNICWRKSSLGHEMDCAFDGNGLLSRLNVKGFGALEFLRNASREEVTRRFVGGTRLQQRHNCYGEIVQQVVQFRGASVLTRRYDYEPAGSLALLDDDERGRSSFTYDSADHLVQAWRDSGRNEFFEYDKAGNVVSKAGGTSGGEPWTYGKGGRLLRGAGAEHEYDANGRLIRKTTLSDSGPGEQWSFFWDGSDQLRSVTTPDGSVWKYTYDGIGRRVLKEGPNTKIRYVWDKDVVLHEVHNDSGLASTWIFEGDTYNPLCTIQGGKFYSVVSDHIGTPYALFDTDGNQLWRTGHDSFGALNNCAEHGIPCTLRFKGQWFDSETGLHYSRFRYMDPATGRFISQDPIMLAGGVNWYAYTPNPINWTDPLGLGCEDEDLDPTLDNMTSNPPNRIKGATAGAAQAGVPAYKPPKNWNGQKVKNPNGPGSGWPHKNGDVWVPTDHKGTHAPHWDVQHSDGSHTPVYPKPS
jgi:RHS repeat-associated protein